MRFKRTLFCFSFLLAMTSTSTGELPVEVFFSPNGGCEKAIISVIDNAKQVIFAQAYGFTSKPIAEALIKAKQRQVFIIIILDKSNVKLPTSQITNFVKSGIPIKIDKSHAIAHDKIMIIDNSIVITGSYNFTMNAEHNNAENVVIIRDKQIAEIFIKNWNIHAQHSTPFR
jgi:phosphatidylserine/phosphatidylglycerophosphate/cardiolipin synthase-like enzyme